MSLKSPLPTISHIRTKILNISQPDYARIMGVHRRDIHSFDGKNKYVREGVTPPPYIYIGFLTAANQLLRTRSQVRKLKKLKKIDELFSEDIINELDQELNKDDLG